MPHKPDLLEDAWIQDPNNKHDISIGGVEGFLLHIHKLLNHWHNIMTHYDLLESVHCGKKEISMADKNECLDCLKAESSNYEEELSNLSDIAGGIKRATPSHKRSERVDITLKKLVERFTEETKDSRHEVGNLRLNALGNIEGMGDGESGHKADASEATTVSEQKPGGKPASSEPEFPVQGDSNSPL